MDGKSEALSHAHSLRSFESAEVSSQRVLFWLDAREGAHQVLIPTGCCATGCCAIKPDAFGVVAGRRLRDL
jgi:hypothetical protein